MDVLCETFMRAGFRAVSGARTLGFVGVFEVVHGTGLEPAQNWLSLA
jgi:hypothetical protein